MVDRKIEKLKEKSSSWNNRYDQQLEMKIKLLTPNATPRHEPIKKVYVEMVKQIVESEAKNDEDAE